MRLRWVLAAALLAALGLSSASAYVRSGPNVQPHGHHRLQVPGGPPLNGLSASSGAYGFRLLRTAYLGSGSAVRLRRASDNLEADIGFDGSGNWDGPTAAAHCAATSCFVVSWYDQSGNARTLTNAVVGNQPALIFACQGALPCLETSAGGTMSLATVANVTPATGLVSFSMVAGRMSGTTNCVLFRENGTTGNRLVASSGAANSWTLAGGTSGSIVAAALDAALHAGQVVMNGAASRVEVDGAGTAGTAVGSVVAGAAALVAAASGAVCRHGELVFWDNYALTAGESAGLTANQRAYWGF